MTTFERLALRTLMLIAWCLILVLRQNGQGNKADQGRAELQAIKEEFEEAKTDGLPGD